jgi:hypothetical protein
MNALLIIFALALGIGITIVLPSNGPLAIIACLPFALGAALIISQVKEHAQFLLRLFFGGLLIRVLVGTLIFVAGWSGFFGSDSSSYDLYGYLLATMKANDVYSRTLVDGFIGGGGSGWGMVYLVAGIYTVVGRNSLAVQFVNCALGAATAPIIFLCAHHIFHNLRVARTAGVAVAFFPSLVLWSCQALKDGPLVFLLALAMLATLKLMEKFDLKFFMILSCALFGILSLRFYIFYMLVATIVSAFVIGSRNLTPVSFFRQFLVLIAIGAVLAYFGAARNSTAQLETFSLERVQRSRQDMASSAQSGFGRDVDVSTTSGALTAIPIGVVYLLFAPFPWQLASLRQSITLPEMLMWWASFPILVMGLWFTIKHALRQASPILVFTTMLTLAYAVFQGNVGTAYRQRSQLLVFYFIFVAVGFVLVKERREDRRRQQVLATQENLAARQQGTIRPKPAGNV